MGGISTAASSGFTCWVRSLSPRCGQQQAPPLSSAAPATPCQCTVGCFCWCPWMPIFFVHVRQAPPRPPCTPRRPPAGELARPLFAAVAPQAHCTLMQRRLALPVPLPPQPMRLLLVAGGLRCSTCPLPPRREPSPFTSPSVGRPPSRLQLPCKGVALGAVVGAVVGCRSGVAAVVGVAVVPPVAAVAVAAGASSLVTSMPTWRSTLAGREAAWALPPWHSFSPSVIPVMV